MDDKHETGGAAAGGGVERVGALPVVAPPTRPGELAVSTRASSWPMVIGIIGIVFGTLGLLMRAGSAAVLVMKAAFGGADAGSPFRSAASNPEWLPWVVLSHIVGFWLALMLLVGGIGMLRRRVWAARVLTIWAIAKFAMALPEAVMSGMIQQADMRAMQASGQVTMPVGFGTGVMVAGVVISVVMAAVVPVVVLVVLGMGRGSVMR